MKTKIPKRHRGIYNPINLSPYELSRSKVEKFVRCNACFWLEKKAGIEFPSIPAFNLNSNTDKLLKKDFDAYRGERPHPIMIKNELSHLIPFAHPDMAKWQSALHFGLNSQYFNTHHEETNILFGGGIDDVWVDTKTGELFLVDYKSTANQSNDPKPITLDGRWKEGYKRQMEMYQWIMRRKGFEVSDTGIFVYVDGLHKDIDGMIDTDPSMATMKFTTSILEYSGNPDWVEPTLFAIKEILDQDICPRHSGTCEFGSFIQSIESVLNPLVKKNLLPFPSANIAR